MAACAALASCNKLNSGAEDPAAPKTHTVSFAAAQPDTRTSMSIEDGYAYFSWEEADADSIYVYENDTPGVVSAHLEGDRMMISATFPGDAPASATYYAHVNSWNVEQYPGPDCYAGSADVLVAEPITAAPEDGILPLVFSREVAVNKVTIKGLGAGELVETLAFFADVPLSGTYVKDGWDPYVSDDLGCVFIYPEDLVVEDDGTIVAYFTCLPVDDVYLTLNLDTRKGFKTISYGKDFDKPISFRKGAVKSFGVVLESEPEQEPKVLIEEFDPPTNMNKTSITSEYGSPALASTLSKNGKEFENMTGFKYSSGWTCSADTSYVSVFKGGIVLGDGTLPGVIANTNMLADVLGDYFTIRIYASWWGSVPEDETISILTVNYDDGTDKDDGAADIDNGMDYLTCIENPESKPYDPSDFPTYRDFDFTKNDSNTFTISVRAGYRLLIDKIEILYYESDDEGGDIDGDGDGEDITVDNPEG